MAVSFCSGCGSQRLGDASFCGNCGKPFDEPAAAPPTVAPPADTEAVIPRLRTSVPDFVQKQLHPDEMVLAAFNASMFDHRRKNELRHDRFVLTSDRIIYYRSSLIHKDMDQLPYRGITGVQYNRGMRHGKVVIEGANVHLTISSVSNDDAAFAERIIASRVAGRTLVAATPAPTASGPSVTTRAAQAAGSQVAKAGTAAFALAKQRLAQPKDAAKAGLEGWGEPEPDSLHTLEDGSSAIVDDVEPGNVAQTDG